MRFKSLLTSALVLMSAAAAWGDDKSAESIQGVWLPTAAELGGQPFPDEVRKTIKLVVKDETYTVTVGKQVDRGTLKVDPAANPKAMDIKGTEGPNKDKTIPAIYERYGDALRICYDLSGKERPKEFKTAAGPKLFLVTYRLEKAEKLESPASQ